MEKHIGIKETMKDLINRYDHKAMKINMDNKILESGRLEALLEETSGDQELAAFECEGKELMMVLRKPCIEY